MSSRDLTRKQNLLHLGYNTPSSEGDLVRLTNLGPLPKPFEATKVLAEASLRGAVQVETEPAIEERRERCAQYLGGTSIDDYIGATLGMLEATTPPADPRDATMFDDMSGEEY